MILALRMVPGAKRHGSQKMGANAFSRPQTQHDAARTLSQVKGSLFDSARR